MTRPKYLFLDHQFIKSKFYQKNTVSYYVFFKILNSQYHNLNYQKIHHYLIQIYDIEYTDNQTSKHKISISHEKPSHAVQK